MIIIKVRILDSDDLRRFSLQENATFEDFSHLISSVYPRVSDLLDTHLIQYPDDEGDLQTIEETTTLAEAIRQASQLNPPVLRITLVPTQPAQGLFNLHPSVIFPTKNQNTSNSISGSKDRGAPQIKYPLVAGPLQDPKEQFPNPPVSHPTSAPVATLSSSQQNRPPRYQNIISLSDEVAQKSLTESLLITQATQQMGEDRATEFSEFADGMAFRYNDVISKENDTQPTRFADDDRNALEALCRDTVSKCDLLNKSLREKASEQLEQIHNALEEEDAVNKKRLAELCEESIKATQELASSVLYETRQHVGNILEVSLGNGTN